MATILDNGDVILIQGDTLKYTITDIQVEDSEINYNTYFAIYDEDRNPMINEVQSVILNGISTFVIPHTETDKLVVPVNDESKDYYFGIKLVNTTNNYEETLQIGTSTYGDLNIITVYPRRVIGLTNG